MKKIPDVILQPYTRGNETETVEKSSSIIKTFLIFSVFFVSILVLLFTKYRIMKRVNENRQNRSANGSEVLHEKNHSTHYIDLPTVKPDLWEVERSNVTVDENSKLGAGAFGAVYKGVLHKTTLNTSRLDKNTLTEDGSFIVAVKTMQANLGEVEIFNFRQEIEFMKNIGHHDKLVNLLACVTVENPLLLVVEYCSEGDLLKYLRTRRTYMLNIDKPKLENEEKMLSSMSLDFNMILSLENLLSFAWQVACGMQYLSHKGIIHRDLAARKFLEAVKNCTLSYVVVRGKTFFILREHFGRQRSQSQKHFLKIGDFGLSRVSSFPSDSVYVGRGGRMPVKWMAIEAIKERTFTVASDVWSFGVLLFEIVTLGGTPYPNVGPLEVLAMLESGHRMAQPDNCSDDLYSIMTCCWEENASLRPTFEGIQLKLSRMMKTLAAQDYYLMLDKDKDYYNFTESIYP